MEVSLTGTKGCYVVRDSDDTAPRSSIAWSYAKVTTLGVGFGLVCLVFWVLSSLTTSFNEQMGSFSMALLFFSFLTSQFYTPSLIDVVGAKASAIGSGLSTVFLAVSYFYPSWYTLMPSAIGMGLGFGLLYAASGAIKNDEVQKCVNHFQVDPTAYQGRFSAIIIAFGIGLSSLSAGSVTCAILYSKTSNRTNETNMTLQFQCASSSATESVQLDWIVYMTLVSTLTGVSLISVFTFCIMGGATYHQCSVCFLGLKDIFRSTASRAVKVFKQAFTPEYGLVMPLRFNQGFALAYFYGVFTKMYITECVGIEFVGISIIVWGAFATLGSFGSGWLMRFTTSYVMVLVCIGTLEIGSFVFLIAWERQPSIEVICILSAIFGLCYGVNATVALAYSGTAPGDSVIGYSVFVIGLAGSEAVQYTISQFISAKANLYLILVTTILAVPLFTVADIHYGSGTSRNICGKKKIPVSVENGDIECEPVGSSKEKGCRGKARRDSTLPLFEADREGSLSNACATPAPVIEEDEVFEGTQ